MATSSVILDIRANTNRALNDFKRFSAQLDNKFLISGLKLDVVRSALGQINREFQKAIGEQGLTAGQSLRAAQNQASLLLQTFKGFGDEASTSISESFSSTFNQIAVTAGGTFDDVKKSLAATPWISANLPKEIREKLGAGVLDFQRDARRAGLGDDFGNVAKKFLAGEVNAGNLLEGGNELEKNLGLRLQQAGGGPSTISDAAQRSRVLLDVLSDPKFRDQIAKAAKGAAGFRIILEDLSSTLFNPEKGIFGAVRKVTMAVGDTTTILDETQKLIESIFGKQGTFVLFFEQIKKIFGLEDPLKTVISGIRWLTKQFDRLNTFLQSPQVQQIVGILRTAFTNVQTFATKLSESITTNLEDPSSKINQTGKKIEEFFKNLKENIDKELKNNDSILSLIKNIGTSVGKFFKAIEETIKAGDWDPSKISQSIRGIGKSIRDFISKIGEEIRSVDVDKQGGFFLDIFTTIVGEVAETLGTAIKEAILIVFSGKGLAVVGGALKVLYEGLSKFFAGLFGGNGPLGAIFGGAAMAGLGILLARRIRGAFDSILRPIQTLRTGGGGALGVINRLFGGGSGPADPNLDPMTGRAAFQGQVITRMDAIIRILAGGGATDLDYGGPSSPIDGGPRRKRPRGGGPDLDAPTRGFRGTTGKRARIGRFGSGIAEFGRNIFTDATSSGFDAAGYPIDDDDFDLPEAASDARGRSTRERFNSRYGSGGRRAQIRSPLRRAGRRLKGIGRGMGRFGRGALVLGIGAGLLNAGGAFASQSPKGEYDPATDSFIEPEQPAQKQGMTGGPMSGGEAFGAIGAKAGEFAMIGAALGPKGAAIGAAIGAGVALLDKGVRDGAIKASLSWSKGVLSTVVDWAKSVASTVVDWSKTLRDGAGSLVQTLFKVFTVDLPGLLLKGLKSLYIDIPLKILAFSTELGKSLVDSVAKFDLGEALKNTWDNIKSFVTGSQPAAAAAGGRRRGGARAAGGNVYEGESYPVGEHGVEWFTPTTNGNITNNATLNNLSSRASSPTSTSATFNITFNVNGNMGAGNVEELRGPVLAIIKQAWEEASIGIASRGSVV